MKYTRKRDCILEYVKSTKKHPTAEEVYHQMQKQMPHISLGTVYRNLDKLAKEGSIVRLEFANGKDRFDGCIKKHYHAICRSCQKVFDVENIPNMEYFDKQVSKQLQCEVLSHDLVFHMICSKCSK